jgi:hypothetical protein
MSKPVISTALVETQRPRMASVEHISLRDLWLRLSTYAQEAMPK